LLLDSINLPEFACIAFSFPKVKLSHYTPHTHLRRYSSYSFFTSAHGGEVDGIMPQQHFVSRERIPGIRCIKAGWDPASLDAEARGRILCPCWGSNTSSSP
jgi:hypothetical protein